jgi:putative transposase
MRWHTHYHTLGTGHLYQGRFKAFPVQADDHLYAVLRYVERNALRAGLVDRAEDWRWSSLSHRLLGAEPRSRLTDGPVGLPAGWVDYVNQPQSEGEVAALRAAVTRGAPYGSDDWQRTTAAELGLASTLRRRGRPRKSVPK